jgi:DNA-binding MarR family transcriptional regulator
MKTAALSSVESATPAKVLRRFRVVFNAVRTHFRHMEKQAGLGGAQVWALSLIKTKPGIGMGEIAASMEIHQSTASNLIKVLLNKELIRAEKSPHDRRNVQLTILPAGSRLLKKVPGPFEGVLPQALANLSGETLQRLDEDLRQLIGLLNADEAAEETPLAQL